MRNCTLITVSNSNDLMRCIFYYSDCLSLKRPILLLAVVIFANRFFLLCPVILVSLDYKRLHFSGLHTGRMPAHVYSEYNNNMPVFLPLQWCDNEVHVSAIFCPWKQMENIQIFYFHQLDYDHLHAERKSVRNREEVLRDRGSNRVLWNIEMWVLLLNCERERGNQLNARIDILKWWK